MSEELLDVQEPEVRRWADTVTHPSDIVYVETGRGLAVAVPVGSPFADTIERISDQAHYGGFFKVYLNGEELVDPSEAPTTIQPNMRIAVTALDKVG